MPAPPIVAPGLKRRANRDGKDRLYWYATPRAVKAGYEPKVVAIHDDNPESVRARCDALQRAMLEYLANKDGISVAADMTVAMLARAYLLRDESPFQSVKWNTQRTYKQTLGVIETTWGGVRLDDINLAVLRRWYNDTRWPEGRGFDESGQPNPDLLRKAHGVVGMIRRIVSFGVAAELPGCDRLDRILSKTDFEAPRARSSSMTFGHVEAFVSCAQKNGRNSLALATALQFESQMRQKDVIGEWAPVARGYESSPYLLNGRQWLNGLTWAHIDKDWILRKRTTKTGAIVEIDLRLLPLSFDLLQAVPEDRRHGPLILDERVGRPYAHLVFGHEWRKIADSAGLPRTVRNMDARSGGATEADEAGASIDDIRRTMGHTDPKMTARYVRGGALPQARRVAELRVAHRSKKGE